MPYRLVDASQQQVEELFAAACHESGIACEYTQHQARAKVTAQRLRHLRRRETLHQVKRIIPLVIIIVSNTLINHIGDIHIATESRSPFFVKTPKKSSRGIARLDGFGSDRARHPARIHRKTNARVERLGCREAKTAQPGDSPARTYRIPPRNHNDGMPYPSQYAPLYDAKNRWHRWLPPLVRSRAHLHDS